jgi:hypothetical protein
MVSASDVAAAAATAAAATAGGGSDHPSGVLASRRRLFGPLLDMKQNSTPLVVTGLFQGCMSCVICGRGM